MSARYELRKVGVFDRKLGRVIKRGEREFDVDYHAWLALPGNVPDPEPPGPPPIPQFNFGAAARARQTRIINRMANTDPVGALLRKAGIKK